MKYVSFPCPPLEVTLSVFNVTNYCSGTIFEKEVIKTSEISVISNHKLSFQRLS